MSNFKKLLFYSSILILLAGCTSLITAPLNVTGSVVTSTTVKL